MCSCCFRASCALCKPDARDRGLSGAAATAHSCHGHAVLKGGLGEAEPLLPSPAPPRAVLVKAPEAPWDPFSFSIPQNFPTQDTSKPDAAVQPLRGGGCLQKKGSMRSSQRERREVACRDHNLPGVPAEPQAAGG